MCEIRKWSFIPVGLSKRGLAEFYDFLTHPQIAQKNFEEKCRIEGEADNGLLIRTSPVKKLSRKTDCIVATTVTDSIYKICDSSMDHATKVSLDGYSQCGTINLVPESRF